MAAPGRPPRPPLISETIADAPTQRLYVVSAFFLLQAFKLADILLPPILSSSSSITSTTSSSSSLPIPPTALLLLESEFNKRLWKWIVLDCVFVWAVRKLRVPRLDWGRQGWWIAAGGLVLLDWVVFGTWKWTALKFLVPSFLKGLLATYLSTTEHSVRLSSLLRNENAHLGGQFTVHILATSTVQLNPASACFCLPSDTRSPNPIHLPLLLNNTAPTRVLYSITPLGSDPTSAKNYSIPASSLIHPTAAVIKAASDELDELDDWAFGKPNKPPSAALNHRLPSSSTAREDDADPLSDLSPSQSLYYLPITSTGIVRLISVLDADGHAIRIRRFRSSLEEGDARILPCPRAGFALVSPSSSTEEHLCLSPAASAESQSLGLQVTGWQPLSVRWHAKGGKVETLEGITSASSLTGLDVVSVPVNASLTTVGTQHFILDSVTDGCGNLVSFDGDDAPRPSHALLKGTQKERKFIVHQPPEVVFAGACGKGEDVRLLQGKKAKLDIRLSAVGEAVDRKEARWTLKVRFTPEGEGAKVTEREVVTTKTVYAMEVDQPGTYEILSVRSKWCDGAVLVPSTCHVVAQPVPTLETSFAPLTDVCNSEIGALATLLLTGTPPFTVSYTLTQHSPTKRVISKSVRIAHSRETLTLEPGPGEWEYRFTGLKDAFYTDLPALPAQEKYVRKQVVQPVGSAQWTSKERMVKSCDGPSVPVEVSLKGLPPWDIEYAVVGEPTQVTRNIKTPKHTFDITIPSVIAQRGGEFMVSLVSVTDGNGCRRPLSAEDLVIDVRRTKPTARFHGLEGARSVVIREKETANIPVRLTGERPWTVEYLVPPPVNNPNARPTLRKVEINSPNANIVLSNATPGEYKLVSVHDQHCPGDVSETDWKISTLPRPKLSLASDIGAVARNGSVLRSGVCENTPDQFSLQFEGKAPFKATYLISKGGQQAEKRTLSAIRNRAEVTLFTGAAGHHSYEFNGVGDSDYTTPEAAGLVAPTGGKSGLLRVEQDVYPLPTVAFKRGAASSFCINDQLGSRSPEDLVLQLTGLPPFEIELEVREEGHRTAKNFKVDNIREHEWPVKVPFTLTTAAPHVITVKRVKDARGCQSVVDQEMVRASTVISVAEIATITPVLPQAEHCVGDLLEFVVQGAPPFTVTYEFNKETHVVSDVSTKFSRLAANPGEFRILSVGHGKDECRSSDIGLVKQIYALPTAHVSHGKETYVDIREGDQTEIIFSFTGEPPFTFTYARRAPQDRTKDRTVLETHTVTGITDHSYSIFTSQEGTWSVSFIADAHCSYPSSTIARPAK